MVIDRRAIHASSSELGNVDLAVVDQSGDLLGALTVDSAAERDASSEDLLDGSSGLNSHTLGAELLGNINDVVELEVAVVLHVLLLLSVTGTFLEGLDDEGCGGGQHSDEALSVLDHHFDLNLNSAPFGGSLLDIFTDLLGGHTEGTALGGEGGSGGDFTTDDLHVH
jgi:hypothetical protein